MKPIKIIKQFQNLFEELLNDNSTNEYIIKYKRLIYQIAEPELMKPGLKEVELIIKHFKNFNALGEDAINPELLKLTRKDLVIEIYLLVKYVWDNVCMPKDWNLGIICPIFNKEDIKKSNKLPWNLTTGHSIQGAINSYQGETIETYAVDIVKEYQCRFKKGKFTTDHMYKLIMRKHYEYNKDLYMLFVNFNQAYDSINHEQLWVTLRNFDLLDALVRLIQICNKQTYCKVRFLEESFTIFVCKTGLRQSNALSPMLFNLAQVKVTRDIPDLKELEIIGSCTRFTGLDSISDACI